jgi:outer membrane protein assembly factor BamB
MSEPTSADVQAFLRGVAGLPGAQPATDVSVPSPLLDRLAYSDYRATAHARTVSGIEVECNQAASLIEGHLLLVYQGRCFQVDPETGRITFLFIVRRSPSAYMWTALANEAGEIFCTVSGAILPDPPIEQATFGTRGAILKVNHRTSSLIVLAEGGHVVDPLGLEFHGDQLLVADFGGFGGSGHVALLNTLTRTSEILAEGGYLIDPNMATMDDDGIVWVANSMHRPYDGEVIRIEPGNVQKVVYPRHGPGSGIVAGIFPGSADHLIFVIIDWPFMARSAVLALDKKSYKTTVLLGASPDDPKVYNMRGAVKNGVLWIAESYNNVLLAYDLRSGKIIKEIDISGVVGMLKGHGVRGVTDSFDFVESLSFVPPQISR